MRKLRVSAAAATLALTAAAALAGQSAASAAPAQAGAASADTSAAFKMENYNSGKCLEVYNWSKAAGANIDQWTCGPNQANQMWKLVENTSTYTFNVQNVNSGMCLQPETATIGALIVQEPCNLNNSLQEWYVVKSSVNVAGTPWNAGYLFENANWPANGPSLDVYGASKANHAWIDLWYTSGNGNQVWSRPAGWPVG